MQSKDQDAVESGKGWRVKKPGQTFKNQKGKNNKIKRRKKNVLWNQLLSK